MSIQIKTPDTFKVAVLSSYIDIATGEPQMNLQVFECVSENEYHFITIENKPISKLIALMITDEEILMYKKVILESELYYNQYKKQKEIIEQDFYAKIKLQNEKA